MTDAVQKQQQELNDASLRHAVRRGLSAARANMIPGLIIWFIAGMVIVLFHYSETVHGWLEALTQFKNKSDYVFAFFSTAIAGGVIPCTVQGVFKLNPRAWQQLKWVSLFWAFKGIEVNALYMLQAHLFGADHDALTLLIKTAVDQLIYIPLWAVPTMVLGYAWIENGWRAMRASLRQQWFMRHCLPVLLANWGVWVPTVCLIYVLPTPLQLPLQNLVLCLWSLIMTVLAAQRAEAFRGAE